MISSVFPAWLSKYFSATGLRVNSSSAPFSVALFFDVVLRGIAQVMLQNNSYTGLVFLVGIFYNSVLLGFAALLGAAVSTATAWVLGGEQASIRAGLYGFNGALVAIALLYFLEPNALTWSYVVVAAACSSVVMAAFTSWLSAWRLPALTAPFVVTTLLFILACARFGRLHSTDILPTAGLLTLATVEGVVSVATLAEGLFRGIAQVFFQDSVITGVLFTLGLCLSARSVAGVALLGSGIGMLVAWLMGADELAIRGGAFGFNAVLTAIVLLGFYHTNFVSRLYALLAVVVSTVVFAALSGALAPIGMPALTAPFVLTTWLFLLASPLFQQLGARP